MLHPLDVVSGVTESVVSSCKFHPLDVCTAIPFLKNGLPRTIGAGDDGLIVGAEIPGAKPSVALPHPEKQTAVKKS